MRLPWIQPVVPMPRDTVRHHVGHAARRIQSSSKEQTNIWIRRMLLDALNDVFVDGVLGDHPPESHGWSDHLIDESLFGEKGLDVADGRFADRPDFKLFAIGPRVGGCLQPAFPVLAIFAKFRAAPLRVVLDVNESR